MGKEATDRSTDEVTVEDDLALWVDPPSTEVMIL